jgi:hypothetical protein
MGDGGRDATPPSCPVSLLGTPEGARPTPPAPIVKMAQRPRRSVACRLLPHRHLPLDREGREHRGSRGRLVKRERELASLRTWLRSARASGLRTRRLRNQGRRLLAQPPLMGDSIRSQDTRTQRYPRGRISIHRRYEVHGADLPMLTLAG